jgi:hypothetical protein
MKIMQNHNDSALSVLKGWEMKKRISIFIVILVSVLLFDFVSFWTARESLPDRHLIQIDAVTGATGCTDQDGDHFCAELGLDCDDTDPAVYPDAPELCDGIDNNCNEIIDGGCSGCTDSDGDSYAVEGDLCGEIDCNDSNATVNPVAEEICDDGIDNNCDGKTDVQDPACQPTCTDEDGDGFCAEEDDCNDSDTSINPDAVEICGDNIDNNCNELVDEDCKCPATLILGDDTESLNKLRAFRDEKLVKTDRGRKFVKLYYTYSPAICNLLNSHPEIKKKSKECLTMVLPLLQ